MGSVDVDPCVPSLTVGKDLDFPLGYSVERSIDDDCAENGA